MVSNIKIRAIIRIDFISSSLTIHPSLSAIVLGRSSRPAQLKVAVLVCKSSTTDTWWVSSFTYIYIKCKNENTWNLSVLFNNFLFTCCVTIKTKILDWKWKLVTIIWHIGKISCLYATSEFEKHCSGRHPDKKFII